MRGKLIGLTGVDGAGKSSQASSIAAHFRQARRPCMVMESKPEYSYQFLNGLALTSGYSSPRLYLGSHAYDIIRALDVVQHSFGTVAPILASGISIVEPRSVFCRLGVALAHGSDSYPLLWDIYSKARLPDITFWIDTEPTVAAQRVRNRGTDEEDAEWLRAFGAALADLSKRFKWKRINGNRKPEEVWTEIKQILDAEI